MKYLLGVTALALSTTALAQTTTTTTSATPPAATTATPAAPATAPAQSTTESTTVTTTAPTTAADAQATTSTTQSTTTAQAAPAPTPAADPKAVLAQQFPTYDKDGNGTLSQTEFAAWLGEMKTAQNTEKLTPAQISKWANDSFAKADKDKSKSVTVAELQGFLVPAA
jgi:hypothetical protein